ncbi:hypothetical protein DID88_007799 [Monilinia fructigena]|uniref:Uncharacterized protein n=1 Tax=Monilinia fructigena TaxID=38457 RepID=A0A395J8I3_9HELO|nr:hypothetical protein DID88_007799 [Monilinia fructigena]
MQWISGGSPMSTGYEICGTNVERAERKAEKPYAGNSGKKNAGSKSTLKPVVEVKTMEFQMEKGVVQEKTGEFISESRSTIEHF